MVLLRKILVLGVLISFMSCDASEKEVPASIQERTWSSPVWYKP